MVTLQNITFDNLGFKPNKYVGEQNYLEEVTNHLLGI